MSLRRGRLFLGPIVGHTDHRSARVWIQAPGDPTDYWLRVQGRGMFPFVGTETTREFGTGIALADGLRSDWRYRYQILYRDRVVLQGRGSFRTMPEPGSLAEVTFMAASCSDQEDMGLWEQMAAYIEEFPPRFLLLMGDQVYMDNSTDNVPNVWSNHLKSKPAARRRAMAEKYRESWSREPLRRIFANTPTYMMWDDHDIRDGWGSWAADSPTLAEAHSKGRPLFDRINAYFEDARDVYWHFQMCHNPPPGVDTLAAEPPAEAYALGLPPAPGVRQAMPFVFRCGRVAVVVADSRGERDLWREESPVLGQAQWEFLQSVFNQLEPDIEVVALVTPVPLVAMDPDGQSQFMVGRRTDDVELFKEGNEDDLLEIMGAEGTEHDEKSGDAISTLVSPLGDLAGAAVSGWASTRFGANLNWGGFMLSDIDDARDQWSNHFSRPEAERLIRETGKALFVNRLPRFPRSAIFVGGDLHSGGLFDVTVDKPSFTAPCLISSGISRRNSFKDPLIGSLVDEEFDVARGIHAKMRQFLNDYNFGVVQVLPTGEKPRVVPAVVTSGNTHSWGLRLNLTPPGVR